MGHKEIAVFLGVVVLVVGVSSQTCPSDLSQECSICYYSGAATRDPKQTDPNQYFVIGGLFDLHTKGASAYTCNSTISEDGMINMLAFFWAIDQYSRNINPGVGVGAVAFDTCSRTDQSIETVLGYAQCKINILKLQQENLVAYVGPFQNEDVLRTGTLAAELGVTMLSPTANSLDLRTKENEDQNSLLRLRPSFDYDILAIFNFLRAMQADYAIVLYSGDDPFWSAAYNKLMQLIGTSNICVQFQANFDNVVNLGNFTANELKSRTMVKYVVPLMSKDRLGQLLDVIRDNQEVNGELRFILTSEIGKDLAFLSSKNDAAKNAIVIETASSSDDDQIMELFVNYINSKNILNDVDSPWMTEILVRLPTLNAKTRSALLNSAMRTIKAVEIVIKGLDNLMGTCNQGTGGNYQFCYAYRNQRAKQNVLYQAIKSAENTFVPSGGELLPNQVTYDYLVYMNAGGVQEFQKIGTYNTSGAIITRDLKNEQLIFGTSFNDPKCPNVGECCEPPTTLAPPTTEQPVTAPLKSTTEAKITYSMVKYRLGQSITGAFPADDQESHREKWGTRFDEGHRWIIALGVLAGLGILSVIVFEIYILYKLLGTRMGHKWRTMWLGQLLLFGVFLAYLVLFAYIFIPTKATCGITRFGVGVSYAICFAVLLVKLMVILTSKSSDVLLPGDVESPNYLKGIYQFLMFVFAVGVQIVIDVQWLITVPPEAVKVRANNGQEVWVCNHYTWDADKGMDSMADFVRTNFENHLMSLVYIMVMILITTILSLNAHGIITNHRESVFIGIAAGFSIPIWLAWGLVGGLIKDHEYAQEFGDACIAFGLFLTVTLILFSMFLPKVRQLVNMGVEGIYLEDDRDTYYAGSVIMAPPSYKSKGPSSVIYVNNQGIYSEPVVVGNGDPNATHLKHALSTYSAPTTYLKKTESAYGGSTRVLRVTDDLRGRHPQKRPQSEVAFGSNGRPRSLKGTLTRSRSQTSLGAL